VVRDKNFKNNACIRQNSMLNYSKRPSYFITV